jgi:CopG family nickel-responsive transcriptional regulator
MQRITVTLDDELLVALDRLVAECGYQNRSEALRDLTRAGMVQLQENTADSPAAMAALAYVYDHRSG